MTGEGRVSPSGNRDERTWLVGNRGMVFRDHIEEGVNLGFLMLRGEEESEPCTVFRDRRRKNRRNHKAGVFEDSGKGKGGMRIAREKGDYRGAGNASDRDSPGLCRSVKIAA